MDVLVSMLRFIIVIFLYSSVSGFLIDGSSSQPQNPVETQSPHRNCSLINADFVFLLDASGSVGSANFNKQINLVKTFVEKSNIGPSSVQVSVVTFSTTVKEVFNLSRYQSKEELLSSLNTIQYSDGSTNTSEGILYVVQHSFTKAAGDRPLVPNFLFVVTDGHSNLPSATKEAANLAHQAGIITFAIGIGSSVSNQELQDIATNPQHVFQVPTFNALTKLQSELTIKTCEDTTASMVSSTKTSIVTNATLSNSVLCFNNIPKCEVYGRSVCSSYVTWAKDNCPLYCGFCTAPTMHVTTTTRVTATSLDTSKTLSNSVFCFNNIPKCEVYGRSVCSSYVTWAKDNCPLYCGFCTAPTMHVTTPTRVTATSTDSPKTSPTTTLPSSTTQAGLTCPVCDENLNCVWNRVCFIGEVCMIRQYHNTPFTVHCSKKEDCIFMETVVKGAEIMCCEDHQCISNVVS